MILSIPRQSIKEPISEIFRAADLLSKAADAHLEGYRIAGDVLFRQADLAAVRNWCQSSWAKPHLNVVVAKPEFDTTEVPKSQRDRLRQPSTRIQAAVLARDGYRCRYCGVPVISSQIRAIAHRLYPEAVPWEGRIESKQHAAFLCLWLQFDHVVPHSHGGSSSEDNIVISCALCNYGKEKYTLRQLGISDPRLRPPEPTQWDGLERLRACTLNGLARSEAHTLRDCSRNYDNSNPVAAPSVCAFFVPGAWIKGEYLYTPSIAGKERWFKIGSELSAAPALRGGISGCRLICSPTLFRRRGLSPAVFLDPDQPV